MSFSSTSVACPFLLGEEGGTVPFGSALRNKLSLLGDGFTLLCCFCRTSFLASKDEQSEAKRSIKSSSTVVGRAMLINWRKQLRRNERERERDRKVIVIYNVERKREREKLEMKVGLRDEQSQEKVGWGLKIQSVNLINWDIHYN